MKIMLWTRHEPLMLKLILTSSAPEQLAIKVYDTNQANTFFANRVKKVDGEQELYVRMPVSAYMTTVEVYNEKNGNQKKGEDASFDVKTVERLPLDITLQKTKMNTSAVRNFVSFATKFAYNAGWLSAPKDYMSSAGGYKIEYLPVITSNKTGDKMATPARISLGNGRIQVAQSAFVNYTIPMRMAILLHEFSHYYLNSNKEDETEADLNGLTIYMGLGYPIHEAHQAFVKAFIGYPTEQNKERYDIINRFIDSYIREHQIKDVYAIGD